MTRIDALLRPVDAAWLAAYRVLFGISLALSMERFLAYGWVDDLLVSPKVRFHYWGLAALQPLSRGAMHALFWVLAALALAVAVGFAFRLTAPLFAAGLTYVQLLDVSTYLNNYYLAALLAWIFAASPASRAWSVDAWIARRRGRASSEEVACAWLVLFRVQIAIVYVFAGLAKAQADWLIHGQPLGIWLGASTDLPLLGQALHPTRGTARDELGGLFLRHDDRRLAVVESSRGSACSRASTAASARLRPAAARTSRPSTASTTRRAPATRADARAPSSSASSATTRASPTSARSRAVV